MTTLIEFRGEQIMALGRKHWAIRSWTKPEEWHSVDTEEWECSCRGFQCLGFCRHIVVIKELERYGQS